MVAIDATGGSSVITWGLWAAMTEVLEGSTPYANNSEQSSSITIAYNISIDSSRKSFCAEKNRPTALPVVPLIIRTMPLLKVSFLLVLFVLMAMDIFLFFMNLKF
jgi:hypothetical protein